MLLGAQAERVAALRRQIAALEAKLAAKVCCPVYTPTWLSAHAVPLSWADMLKRSLGVRGCEGSGWAQSLFLQEEDSSNGATAGDGTPGGAQRVAEEPGLHRLCKEELTQAQQAADRLRAQLAGAPGWPGGAPWCHGRSTLSTWLGRTLPGSAWVPVL